MYSQLIENWLIHNSGTTRHHIDHVIVVACDRSWSITSLAPVVSMLLLERFLHDFFAIWPPPLKESES